MIIPSNVVNHIAIPISVKIIYIFLISCSPIYNRLLPAALLDSSDQTAGKLFLPHAPFLVTISEQKCLNGVML